MSVEFLSYLNEVGCTNVPDISWVTTAGNWKTVSGGASTFEPAFNFVQWVRDHSENDYYNLIYIDNNNYFRLIKTSATYGYKTEWCYNGTTIAATSSSNNADQNVGFFAFGIDDDNQIGYLSTIKQRSSSATTSFAVSDVYKGNVGGHQTDFYNLIKNSIPTHQSISGGAGSGYIGNSLVSNKKMVGYDVPTSDATNTKTESVQVYSAAPFVNKPKMGDGFARIKFLSALSQIDFEDACERSDFLTHYLAATNTSWSHNLFTDFTFNNADARNSDYTLVAGSNSNAIPWSENNGIYTIPCNTNNRQTLHCAFPINDIKLAGIRFDYQFTSSSGTGNSAGFLRVMPYIKGSSSAYSGSNAKYYLEENPLNVKTDKTPTFAYKQQSWFSNKEIYTTDFNWHSVVIDFYSPLVVDRLDFYADRCVNMNIKNIKFLYVV